jgi:hypothetical protein
MANKYDHLFIHNVPPEIQAHRPYATFGFLDGKMFPGCNEYSFFWVGDKPYGSYGTEEWGIISHGPHEHKYPELFVHLGTDPDNPYDLGGEVEMYMGPEMEKHVISKSVIMYIPANFPHGPWRILNVKRPFLIITINQNPEHTEKALPFMIPEKDHNRMIFINSGYEEEGIQSSFHWPELAGPQGDYM